jgi:hypothetical protein
MKKILPYLILNFIVSAVAMLLVLVLWNTTHKVGTLIPAIPAPAYTGTEVVVAPSTTEGKAQGSIEIEMVVGAGDLDLEMVQFKNSGKVPVDLNGWTVSNGSNLSFTFPLLVLYPDGGLNLFSKSGVNTSIELFWGRSTSAWQAGETIRLVDTSGVARSEFQIH